VRAAKQQSNRRRLEIDAARRRVEQTAIGAWEDLETARAQIRSFVAEVRATDIALEGVRQENAVGARTILDILDAQQELLGAQVNLTRARRDEIVAGFQVFSAMGRLTAAGLGLPVEIYDPDGDYRAVRDSWFGLTPPGQ
jgi:outer membrane protein TolC